MWATVGVDSETLLDQAFQLGPVSIISTAGFVAVVEFEAVCIGVNLCLVHKLEHYFADVPDHCACVDGFVTVFTVRR
jgi:hypothetical protein